jgi:ribonucleotide reductase beta subunit family protein with ferritin-like domain
MGDSKKISQKANLDPYFGMNPFNHYAKSSPAGEILDRNEAKREIGLLVPNLTESDFLAFEVQSDVNQIPFTSSDEDLETLSTSTTNSDSLEEKSGSTECGSEGDYDEFIDLEKNDPLLKPTNKRFLVHKPTYPDLWDMYKQAQASFWSPEEIDLHSDILDWNTKLNDEERHFISNILAFFASSDGIVIENLSTRFLGEIQIPEARCFYGFQIAMENIHSETYASLIETYIESDQEKDRLFDAIETIDAVKVKAKWAMKWLESENVSFTKRLVAFAAVEGILFSSSFCAIFWLKKKALLPGLTFSNELITRDEGLHCDFAVLLYSKLQNKLPEIDVHKILKEATECELNFVKFALEKDLLGMNVALMSKYVKFCTNRLSLVLGYRKVYSDEEASNPFEWLDMISMDGKTNFFERRVGEYQKSSIATSKKTSLRQSNNLTENDFCSEVF